MSQHLPLKSVTMAPSTVLTESTPVGYETEFEIELVDDDGDWGAKLTSDLRIISLRPDSPFTGRCQLGDQITHVSSLSEIV